MVGSLKGPMWLFYGFNGRKKLLGLAPVGFQVSQAEEFGDLDEVRGPQAFDPKAAGAQQEGAPGVCGSVVLMEEQRGQDDSKQVRRLGVGQTLESKRVSPGCCWVSGGSCGELHLASWTRLGSNETHLLFTSGTVQHLKIIQLYNNVPVQTHYVYIHLHFFDMKLPCNHV